MSKLKERFESEGKEINPKELNYKVGNTSGMDVGQVPAEIAERVGNLAQRGGGEMEILLDNPATFHVDREDLFNTIQGLEIDVSFHSDPSTGYTSAYKTAQGGGFDVSHSYFTKYLKEYASFKKEKEERDDLDFRLGRINPHISTDPMPSLRERMAQDVSLDPFGFPISKFNDHINSMRDDEGENIYKNKEFLKKFYRTFVVDEFGDREYQYFSDFYINFSKEFDKIWRKKQNEIADKIYEEETGKNGSPIEDKVKLLSVVSRSDPSVSSEWLRKLEKNINFKIEEDGEVVEELGTLEDVDEEIREYADVQYGLSRLNTLPELYYFLSNGELSKIKDKRSRREPPLLEHIDQGELWDKMKGSFREAIDELWHEEAKNSDDLQVSLIPVKAKIGALSKRLEIPQDRILERAFTENGNKEELRDAAAEMFAGNPKYYSEGQEGHEKFLDVFVSNFEQALWMESNIFYKIIPAWMSSSNEEYEDDGEVVHEAFEAPEFLWKVIVEREYGEQSFDQDYLKKLESDPDFRQDVAAASAAAYVWSHFTQIESQFDADRYQYIESDNCTWIEWMNRYGIGINFEAMYGGPDQKLKLWRSKDIVAAARAINITARKDIDEFHEELYGSPAKFTIDMEHVSSFGINPWNDIEDLIEMEKWIADNNEWDVPADEDKPLAEMVRMYHLTKPGFETRQSASGHNHGPFRHGDTQLYTWLHDMVENGFTQSDERASIMYEVGGEMTGTVQKAKLSMNMIELGISPEELDPAKVDPGKEYRNEEEALIARFYGMDRPAFNREWAKIEDHAFDPLQGLLESTEFDYTWTSSAAVEKRGNRPQEFQSEEYK